MERLSRFLSRKGIASRRKAETIVRDGLVKVNRRTVLDPFYEIDPEKDVVTVSGHTVAAVPLTKLYIALNKPPGYISDLADPKGRPLARALIPVETRLYPVGRLDYASEGLIIFTNDGDFANTVLHPRYQIIREYEVKLQRPLAPQEIQALTTGRRFEGVLYRLRSAKLRGLTQKNAWYVMTATEGRNRLIRKLAESLGHRVLRLRRVSIGPIRLGNLKPGQYRYLTSHEVKRLLDRKDGE